MFLIQMSVGQIVFGKKTQHRKSGATKISTMTLVYNQGILRGKYHCTIDLLSDRFGLVCFANKNKNFQLSCS
jgi:hypothetical protein